MRVLGVVVPAGLVGLGVAGWLLGWHLGVDSAVYRSGALALLNGEGLYDSSSLSAEPSWARLPFTYPPFAALLFVPLAAVPTQVAWGVLAAISVGLLVRVVRLCAPGWAPEWAPGAAILLLGLEPLWRTIALGQVNIILMALVVIDVLVPGKRYGGVLIGIAAAIKLTPLIFVPHLFVTGRRMDAVRALGTFAAAQALMWVIVPHDAARYWGQAVQDPGRIGPIHTAGNQSLNGLLLRLTDNSDLSLPIALGIGALLAVPCLLWVRRLTDRPLAALLVTAFLGLLISPVSWSHHWVWAAPLVVFLLVNGRKVAAAAVAVVFASCVLIAMRHGGGVEFSWTAAEHVFGSAYLLVPLVAGGIVLVRRLTAGR